MKKVKRFLKIILIWIIVAVIAGAFEHFVLKSSVMFQVVTIVQGSIHVALWMAAGAVASNKANRK